MNKYSVTVTDRRGKYAPREYVVEAETELGAYGPATEQYIKDNNHPPYRSGVDRMSVYYRRFWNEATKIGPLTTEEVLDKKAEAGLRKAMKNPAIRAAYGMKPKIPVHRPRYDEKGMRLTDCCGALSTYCDGALCCKGCYALVPVGQGDGNEYKK